MVRSDIGSSGVAFSLDTESGFKDVVLINGAYGLGELVVGGEISPDEFKFFIGEDIRLDPVMMDKTITTEQLLEFYMGKNTPDRQKFIIENLKVELDFVEEQSV